MTWSTNCAITNSRDVETFAITHTKLHFVLVTLPTQNYTKTIKIYEIRIHVNNQQEQMSRKVSAQAQSQYLVNMIDPGLQGACRPFFIA